MMRVSKPIDGLELELEVKTMEKIVQDYKTEGNTKNFKGYLKAWEDLS